MARPAKYGSDEERRAADAERKRRVREQLVDPSLPVTQVDEPESPGPVTRSVFALIELPWGAVLSEPEEQLVRDFYGYASSESRTRAERAGWRV